MPPSYLARITCGKSIRGLTTSHQPLTSSPTLLDHRLEPATKKIKTISDYIIVSGR